MERRVAAMGTALRITVDAPDRRAALLASEAALRAIEATESRLSTWREGTELARLNAAGQATLRPATLDELRQALGWAGATGGAFDPTCGALVDVWGLRGTGSRPDEAVLERALATVGADRVVTVAPDEAPTPNVRLEPGTRIEEGAWGKGAGLDRALEALADSQARAAVLDLGGQVAWYGALERRVDIAHPDRRDSVAARLVAPAWCVSVATSGNSERRLVVDGEPLGHLLDPRTGHPAPDRGSVTVLARGALMADALATACYVLGPDRSLDLAASLDGLELVYLERDGERLRLRCSPGLADAVELLDPTLTVATDAAGAPAPDAEAPRRPDPDPSPPRDFLPDPPTHSDPPHRPHR